MSLYDDLGVPRDADANTIKAAHRRKAKDTHPDTGGDREEFDKIQRAGIILRDPEKRARYDATGDTEDPRDNTLQAAAQTLIGAFSKVMEGIMRSASQIEYLDIAEKVRTTLANDLAGHAKAELQAKAELAQVEKMRKRFTFKGEGPDFLDNLFANNIGGINAKLASIEAMRAATVRAQALAAHYECEVATMKAGDTYTITDLLNLQMNEGGWT